MKAGPDGRNYKKRWFVLNKARFLYFKTPQDGTPSGEISLTECSIVKRDRDGINFEIVNDKTKRVFYLQAKDQMDRDYWIDVLEDAKTRNSTQKRSSATGSVNNLSFLKRIFL